MKSKLKFLTKQSLDKKIKTKWFKAVNVFLLILLILITNIDRIISYFGGDFKDEITVLVRDEIGGYETFKEIFESTSTMLGESKNFKLEQTFDSLEDLKQNLEKDENKLIISITPDEQNYIKGELISYDETDTITSQLISSSLNSMKSSIAAANIGLTEEQIIALSSPVELEKTTTNPDSENQEGKDLVASGVILVLILPCFFLILMLVQMIGAEVNDEKSTRSMEIIISNVPPKTHFLSKIIASTAFVIIQGLLLVLYGVIAYFVRRLLGGASLIGNAEIANSLGDMLKVVQETGVINTLLQGLPFILILFVFSFIAYAIVAGVLASMTTSIEDFQQLQTPIMLVIMVGYYLAIMAVQFEGALFIKIASYVPMLSFLLSPALYLLGQISLWELGISTLVMGIFTWIIFKYGLRIYKVGILNYSSTKLWKKMFKSLKQK